VSPRLTVWFAPLRIVNSASGNGILGANESPPNEHAAMPTKEAAATTRLPTSTVEAMYIALLTKWDSQKLQ
jgi:hypothetical protein